MGASGASGESEEWKSTKSWPVKVARQLVCKLAVLEVRILSSARDWETGPALPDACSSREGSQVREMRLHCKRCRFVNAVREVRCLSGVGWDEQ